MSVARWSGRHARSIIFLLIALVAGGTLGTFVLPVSLFPRVDFPRIRVNLEAGDQPAEQMELQVTRPVELALRGIPGARGVESTTSRGSAEVSLTFDWGQDMTTAYLQAQAEVNRVIQTLPPGSSFSVRRMDPTVFPVIAYSVTSPTRPLADIRQLAQYTLAPVLSEVSGVSKVGIDGGDVAEFHVVIDPARLAAYGLAINDLSTLIRSANTLAAVGRVQDRGKLQLVISDARFGDIEALADLPIRAGGDGVIRLRDVADVSNAVVPNYTHSVADGHDCVLLNVYQQPGGNTPKIAAGIRDTLAAEAARLPKDVTITAWYDQSDLISESATGVRDAVIIGVALAALVLLLFLRDWRMTLIATLSVPVVLAITAGVLYLVGESFNIMTLGGMAAAVGLIIDDAIVIAEHIARRLQERAGVAAGKIGGVATGVVMDIGGGVGGGVAGGVTTGVGTGVGESVGGGELAVADAGPRADGGDSVRDQVQAASDEFTRPLAGSSLSTIVIHIPPAFLVGVFGAFFAALSLSMATSLVISFLVAWLVIPVLAARFLKVKAKRRPGEGPTHPDTAGVPASDATESSDAPDASNAPAATAAPDASNPANAPEPSNAAHTSHASHASHASRTERAYAAVMRPLLANPWLALLIAAPLLIGGYFAFRTVPSGLMPQIDEGGFVIDYVGPPGASIAEMDRLLGYVERKLQNTPEVLTWSRRTGFSLGGDISETNTGDFFVRLKSLPRRPIDEVMDDVRGTVERQVPGLEIEPLLLMEDLLGDLSGQPQPVVVNLFGSDEKQLTTLSPKIGEALASVPGLSSIEDGVIPAGDALVFTIDRTHAALDGLDPDLVTTQISDLLSGSVATQVQQGQQSVGVRVWTPPGSRYRPEDLAKLNVRAGDGHLVPLGRVARFEVLPGQPEITRQDLQRVVRVTARSSRDLGSTIADVKRVLQRPGLVPPSVRYTLGGLYEQQQQAFRGTIGVVIAAGSLVFLLLLFMYESLRVAVAILLTTGFAIAAVFIGLALTGTELNISSMMGTVMIVGNVTEVAIFYFSEYVELPADGRSGILRLIAAGNHRLRAIAMTTLAAILALLPLALDWGHHAGMLRPLAIAIITGLLVQLPLVLVLLPALLALFGVGRRRANTLGRPAKGTPARHPAGQQPAAGE